MMAFNTWNIIMSDAINDPTAENLTPTPEPGADDAASEAQHRAEFPDAPPWYTAAVRRSRHCGYLDGDGNVIESDPALTV